MAVERTSDADKYVPPRKDVSIEEKAITSWIKNHKLGKGKIRTNKRCGSSLSPRAGAWETGRKRTQPPAAFPREEGHPTGDEGSQRKVRLKLKRVRQPAPRKPSTRKSSFQSRSWTEGASQSGSTDGRQARTTRLTRSGNLRQAALAVALEFSPPPGTEEEVKPNHITIFTLRVFPKLMSPDRPSLPYTRQTLRASRGQLGVVGTRWRGQTLQERPYDPGALSSANPVPALILGQS